MVNHSTQYLTKGGKQRVNFINESGLYSLIISSKLPKAQEFRHWVTNEVLPSISKTGSYSVPKATIQIESIKNASEIIQTLLPVMTALGLSQQEAALTVCSEAKNQTGYDIARLLPQSYFKVNEEEIKQPISFYLNGDKSLAAKANIELSQLGYIKKEIGGWVPTEKGRSFGIIQVSSKPNGASRTIITNHYPSKVRELIKDLIPEDSK